MIDPIADALDCEPVPSPSTEVATVSPDDFEEKVRAFRANAAAFSAIDYSDSRDNLRSIIRSGMEMMPDVAQAVRDTQEAKAIHAASDFMKTLADINERLVRMNNDVLKPAKQSANMPAATAPKIEQHIGTNQMIVMADAKDIFNKAKETEE